jgi:carboxyl-terminal processing protease
MQRKVSLPVVFIIFFIAFMLGGVLGVRGYIQSVPQRSEVLTSESSEVDLAPLWKTWELLDERFVPATTTEPMTDQERVWGMIEGLAKTYGDPYTTFMPPREARQFAEDMSGAFGGVGIEIGMRESLLTVIAPLKGTPGERAGLRSGDIIVSIDSESTRDMSIDEAIERIRGEAGTDVILSIAREGESEFLDITVTREIITIPTLDTETYEGGVFGISLYNFGATSDSSVRSAIREFLDSDNTTLLFDLRGNPGGYLESAVEIAGYFLPVGAVVVTEERGASDQKVHRSKGYGLVKKDVRVAVLVDGGSASASEILAGALRAHGHAVLIGEKTFGKGSVQELIEITPETSLKVTIARWLTPDGISISYSGLTPDHVVSRTREDFENDVDPQLDVALEYLRTGSVPEVVVETEVLDTEEGDVEKVD